jgi:hypothetical protein
VYDVRWKGAGPLGLPAGQAVLTVHGPGEGPLESAETPAPAVFAAASYRFTLEARTAQWVSRFFEAEDRFETWADGQLLPLEHHQHIREGRRRLDRASRFDAGRGTVEIEGGPRMPLAIGARDPLAAFHYARTIALAPGSTVRLPVSEAGRQLLVTIAAGQRETLEHRGTRLEAQRLEVVVDERLQRRQPLAATIWISSDGRRVPVALEVSAGFGSFRADLVSYESGRR